MIVDVSVSVSEEEHLKTINIFFSHIFIKTQACEQQSVSSSHASDVCGQVRGQNTQDAALGAYKKSNKSIIALCQSTSISIENLLRTSKKMDICDVCKELKYFC